MARFWEWQLIRVDSQSRSFRCPRLSQSHRLKPCVPAILRHLVTNSIVRYASSAPYWQSPSDHATQILLRRSGNLFQVSPYSTPPYLRRSETPTRPFVLPLDFALGRSGIPPLRVGVTVRDWWHRLRSAQFWVSSILLAATVGVVDCLWTSSSTQHG